MNSSPRIHDLALIALPVIVSATAIWIYTISPHRSLLVLGLAAGVTVLLLSLNRFTVFFLTLLALRSSLDVLGGTGFSLGGAEVNVASLLGILILLGGGIYLLRRRDRRWPLIAIVFAAWVLSLVPFGVVSYARFGGRSIGAARELIRLSTVLMVFVLTYNTVSAGNKRWFYYVIIFSLAAPLLAGYGQLITGSAMTIDGVRRIRGTMVHPNQLALFLVIFIALAYWRWRVDPAPAWWLLLAALFIALLATVSMTGILMFFLLLAILLWRENLRWRLIILGTLLAAGIIFSRADPVRNRLAELEDLNWGRGVQQHQVIGSFAWRICNFWNLIGLWEERPFFGYGLETTKYITPSYFFDPTYLDYRPAAAHNDYLKYLVETGLGGFFLYLAFNLLILLALYREYQSARQDRLKRLLYTLFAVYLVWQIGSLADNFITATAVQFTFWATLGVALKCRVLENNHGGK